MRRDAVLGLEVARIKTDMRLPAPVHSRMVEMARALGVPMNAVLSVAIAFFAVKLADILPAKSREYLVRDLQDLFKKVLEGIEK